MTEVACKIAQGLYSEALMREAQSGQGKKASGLALGKLQWGVSAALRGEATHRWYSSLHTTEPPTLDCEVLGSCDSSIHPAIAVVPRWI